MPQLNDLSRSLVALDQDNTIIAVVELSQSSWLVAGVLPGIERQPRKKLDPSPERLLAVLHRWRDEAVRAGQRGHADCAGLRSSSTPTMLTQSSPNTPAGCAALQSARIVRSSHEGNLARERPVNCVWEPCEFGLYCMNGDVPCRRSRAIAMGSSQNTSENVLSIPNNNIATKESYPVK
jgi:hypothetical protein